MDGVKSLEGLTNFIKRYKFVILVVALGIGMMLIPGEREAAPKEETVIEATESRTTEEALEEILGLMDGVGKVKVLLTCSTGHETIYQEDTDVQTRADGDSSKIQTVIVTGTERNENGLIRQINPPVYLGAVIVCQGGESPDVRLHIIEAVSKATGLSTDRITVLKMK